MEIDTTAKNVRYMKAALPPKWAVKFLHAICPEHLLEEIEGDLIQKFHRDLQSDHSKWSDDYRIKRARRRFVWNTIRFFRPGILLRNNPSINITPLYMLTNYFKVAFRVMLRSKTFSMINVFGLALGITGAVLLFLWIQQEFSYDQFHTDKHHIYKAWNRASENDKINCWDVTPRILAPTLKEEFASVESAISYAKWHNQHLFTAGETRLAKNSGVFTDPAFLTMFSFPLIKGDPSEALENSTSIVLTENFARQLFGDKEAFGETITIGESGYSFPFTITGILKDLPSNTDFQFEYLIPFQFLESIDEKDTYWGNNSVSTYVKLKEGSDITSFNNEIKNIVRKHFSESSHTEIFLYPLTKMRLYARFENGVPAGGRIEIMRMLGILGTCLIAIACINFINLSTARAQKRSKEVAVRKVTGAYRHSLIIQFLCESILIAFGAGIISLLATRLALPFFNTLVQQQLSLDFQNITFWASALAFIILIGILAGSYPALYLSSFRPVRILKGASITSVSRNKLRSLLVIFQFGFAVTLIVSAIVIHRQIEFVQNREAGYAKDNLMYHYLTGDLVKNYEAYKNELIQSGVAVSVTKTSSPITERWSNTTGIEWKGKAPQDKTMFERFYIDENISTTVGITIMEGRDMDLQRFPSDSTAALLNETAVKAMGFQHPIGEIIIDNDRKWHVEGVIKDFILTSPYQKVEPIVLLGSKAKWALNVIHIKLNSANPVQQNLTNISNLFLKYNPAYPFEYHFADVEYEQKFAGIKKTLTITTLFTSIAIFIACLGLLGLSTYMIEARVKEIGIRKVMGGSVLSITRLLSLSSLKPILIAIVLFSPQAWFAMNWWLQSFAYRIALDVWMFLIAALTILFIALITIGTQTIRAANVNPVNSLRNE